METTPQKPMSDPPRLEEIPVTIPGLAQIPGFSRKPFAVNNDQVKEFEEKYAQARFRKGLILEKVDARVLDLSKSDDRAEYLRLRREIFEGEQSGTRVMNALDRQFHNGTWLVYLEWGEINMETIANPVAAEASMRTAMAYGDGGSL